MDVLKQHVLILGRNVFITGATGYLGGVLLFKLLSHCPEIGKVYLLIRDKKGESSKERLAGMKEHFFYKDIQGNQLDKVRVIAGDTQEIGMLTTIQ